MLRQDSIVPRSYATQNAGAREGGALSVCLLAGVESALGLAAARSHNARCAYLQPRLHDDDHVRIPCRYEPIDRRALGEQWRRWGGNLRETVHDEGRIKSTRLRCRPVAGSSGAAAGAHDQRTVDPWIVRGTEENDRVRPRDPRRRRVARLDPRPLAVIKKAGAPTGVSAKMVATIAKVRTLIITRPKIVHAFWMSARLFACLRGGLSKSFGCCFANTADPHHAALCNGMSSAANFSAPSYHEPRPAQRLAEA
jgi:hypothetical protein